MYTIEELTNKVNSYIESIEYPANPQQLYEPIRYILSLGGKRIRPVLMLMAYNLYKETVEDIMPQAVALETYHNFTLLHDDLMDKSDMRRGNLTVHKKWNDNTAILSGDTMLILAYQFFTSNQNPVISSPAVTKEFVDATIGVCEGQQYDIDFETRNDVTEAEYMEMIRMKTSLLLGYALKIGAMLAGAKDEDAEQLYQFGEKMGLAFQLQDDLLDVYGDTRYFKKKLGADIVDNKKTFLLINAMNLATGKDAEELKEWIGKDEFDAEEKISAVTHIYNNIGIKELTQAKIEQMFSESLQCLNAVNIQEKKKEQLRNFADKLLGRKY